MKIARLYFDRRKEWHVAQQLKKTRQKLRQYNDVLILVQIDLQSVMLLSKTLFSTMWDTYMMIYVVVVVVEMKGIGWIEAFSKTRSAEIVFSYN